MSGADCAHLSAHARHMVGMRLSALRLPLSLLGANLFFRVVVGTARTHRRRENGMACVIASATDPARSGRSASKLHQAIQKACAGIWIASSRSLLTMTRSEGEPVTHRVIAGLDPAIHARPRLAVAPGAPPACSCAAVGNSRGLRKLFHRLGVLRFSRGLAMSSTAAILRPPAPTPHERPLGPLALLRTLRSNPLECWTKAHFEEPIVVGGFPFARVAVINDPAAVRKVLVEDQSTYQKAAMERRVLSAGMPNGLVTVDGEQWQRLRRTLAPLFGRTMIARFASAMARTAAALIERWQRL